jgi:hypothetical protein
MQGKIFAIIAVLLMMIQPTMEKITLTSDTVVGNILYENMALYPVVLIMLIVALMI